jgi:EF hand
MLLGLMSNRQWLLLFGLLLGGCGFSSASMEMPEWDPATAADRALSEHDSNGDRKLSVDELKKSPGLLSAIKTFDQDRDGSISADELKSNLQEILGGGPALVELACVVTRSGRPVEGATVMMVPESFMGETFQPATGVTAPNGTAYPSIAQDAMPEEYRGRIQGIPTGIYRIEVTHPNFAVPGKYNTQTEVGQVVTLRTRDALTINF